MEMKKILVFLSKYVMENPRSSLENFSFKKSM